mmetsp:Transcript_20575/g.58291  ORF Transcript_20575/g.58291 Transcript_20575/m.58291 type:complete len:203 (-) Transcript_20575:710-1318(-)
MRRSTSSRWRRASAPPTRPCRRTPRARSRRRTSSPRWSAATSRRSTAGSFGASSPRCWLRTPRPCTPPRSSARRPPGSRRPCRRCGGPATAWRSATSSAPSPPSSTSWWRTPSVSWRTRTLRTASRRRRSSARRTCTRSCGRTCCSSGTARAQRWTNRSTRRSRKGPKMRQIGARWLPSKRTPSAQAGSRARRTSSPRSLVS